MRSLRGRTKTATDKDKDKDKDKDGHKRTGSSQGAPRLSVPAAQPANASPNVKGLALSPREDPEVRRKRLEEAELKLQAALRQHRLANAAARA